MPSGITVGRGLRSKIFSRFSDSWDCNAIRMAYKQIQLEVQPKTALQGDISPSIRNKKGLLI